MFPVKWDFTVIPGFGNATLYTDYLIKPINATAYSFNLGLTPCIPIGGGKRKCWAPGRTTFFNQTVLDFADIKCRNATAGDAGLPVPLEEVQLLRGASKA